MLIKVQCERSETFRSGWIVGSTWQSAQFPLLKMEGIIMDSCSVRYAVNVLLSWFYSGALAREARSGAPWVTKCGKLPIRENLVIT